MIEMNARIGAGLALIALAATACGGATEEAADYVFTNGFVYTVDDANPTAEAVAVRGNQIVYVGDAPGAEAFVGDGTEVVDVEGRPVLPGFISAHDHLIASTWILEGVDLGGAQGLEETLTRIGEYAEANPDAPVIRGFGWSVGTLGGQLPTAADLDRVVPDRPAYIVDYSMHDGWLNSAALAAGNVTRNTPDTQPGTIYWIRDDQGNPTGVGIEFQWMPLFVESGAWQAEATFRRAAPELMGIASRNGTTTVQVTGIVTPTFKDAIPMQQDFQIAMDVLTEMKDAGSLPMRVFPMPIYKDATGDIDDFVAFSSRMRDTYDDDMLRVQSIKIHPEGNWSAHGAPMLEPYADRDTRGAFGVSPEQTREIFLKVNEAGMNVIIHTDGDASARAAIEAQEAAVAAGYGDIRNAIHHLIWLHPDDYPRIIESGIAVNSTPSFTTDWANNDEAMYQLLGEARTNERITRYPDLARDGVNVTISADVPSTLPSMQAPLFVIEAAVTLQEPSEPETSRPFPPSRQGMSVEQAVRAMTIDAAWQLYMEDKIGSLEVGKYADLVVLEANPFEVEPTMIEEIDVLLTMLDGEIVHQVETPAPDTYDSEGPHLGTGEYRTGGSE